MDRSQFVARGARQKRWWKALVNGGVLQSPARERSDYMYSFRSMLERAKVAGFDVVRDDSVDGTEVNSTYYLRVEDGNKPGVDIEGDTNQTRDRIGDNQHTESDTKTVSKTGLHIEDTTLSSDQVCTQMG